jgi:hypothetical protein
VTDPDFMDWAGRFQMKYAVTRPDTLETRFWHFREPLFGPGGERDPFYVLFDIRQGAPTPVRLPEVSDGLRRVPGL